MLSAVPFDNLPEADLHVDRVYRGGTVGNVSDDPISRLLPVGNQGGFRYKGSPQNNAVRMVVLYSTGDDPEWPDALDPFTGNFTYYGDNKAPGRELHDTQRRGNLILRQMFETAHGSPSSRAFTPPAFVFSRTDRGRDVVFRGLAVPGSSAVPRGEDLVAVWRVRHGSRFQNYRAVFTILDEAVISRSWIRDLLTGPDPNTQAAPTSWKAWVTRGVYTALISQRVERRSRAEQLPQTEAGKDIVAAIHKYFTAELADPHRFEECAVEIWRRFAPATGGVDLTRPYRDGGRDAIGTYLLGPIADRLGVEFALEAKCYGTRNSVGVREISRLISRLRFRQFGVFVTTSHFDSQAYAEVRLDQHPVVLICARDIAEVLQAGGLSSVEAVESWLRERFPPY